MKNVKSLVKPEWFELDKYRDQIKLSRKEWAFQLSARLYFSKFSKHEKTQLKSGLHDLFQQPIIKMSNYWINEERKWLKEKEERIEKQDKYKGLFQENISPLNCYQLHVLNEEFMPRRYKIKFKEFPLKKDEYFERYSKKLVDETCAKSMYRGKSYEGLDIEGLKYLYVDLFASDEVLQESFKRYLTEARKIYSFPEGGDIKPSITSRLVENNVLAFIDLTLWAEFYGVNLPYHKLGDWLFPDSDVDVTEKIRKVTKPLVEKVYTMGFVQALSK